MTDHENLAALGRIIRARRERLGLAQSDLEQRGGPGERTVSRLERHEATVPRDRTRRGLEDALVLPAGTLARVLSGELTEDSEDLRAMVNGQVLEGEPARTRVRLFDGEVEKVLPREPVALLGQAVAALSGNPNLDANGDLALWHVMEALALLRGQDPRATSAT